MKCCASHGLPIDCLEQKLDSKSSSHHNSTHMVITTIMSKECHDYKSILEECKNECIKGNNTDNILDSGQVQYPGKEQLFTYLPL